tara:strand:- start:2231 stop:2647 length:417 start_codon:yes stop_codon:yes gene_type:complete
MITKKIKNHLNNLAEIFDVKVEGHFCNILNFKEIPSEIINGVYILFYQNQIIYVGKGIVRNRQEMHIEKLSGHFNKAKDTVGFKLLRNKKKIIIGDCQVYYFNAYTKSASSAFESALIHFLQPLANKETFEQFYKSEQ